MVVLLILFRLSLSLSYYWHHSFVTKCAPRRPKGMEPFFGLSKYYLCFAPAEREMTAGHVEQSIQVPRLSRIWRSLALLFERTFPAARGIATPVVVRSKPKM